MVAAARLQLLDAIGIDDVRAVDADEAVRIEPRLHRRHRLAEEIGIALHMQPHVVPCGVHPVDFVRADEEDPAARFHDQPIRRMGLVRLEILHHREEPLAEVAGALAFQPLARAIQRAQEPRAVERLQQVVERVDLEGPQRVLVVGRREDHHRDALRREGAYDAKPIHDGNLHVEEHELGLEPLDGRERLGAIRTLPHDLDVGLLLQQREHALARHRLVVDYQGANLGHGRSTPLGEEAEGRFAPFDGSHSAEVEKDFFWRCAIGEMGSPFVPELKPLVTAKWLRHRESRSGPKSLVPQKTIGPCWSRSGHAAVKSTWLFS